MAPRKADRRVRRTTKRLEDALTELMLEIPYDKITVQDIIDRGDVSRSTFYAHFDGKDDLLTSDFDKVLNLLRQHLGADRESPFSTLELFQHVGENYALYRALLWGSGLDLLFQKGHVGIIESLEGHLGTLQTNSGNSGVPVALLANHVSVSLLAMLRWWLENEMPYSPEEMNQYFQRLVMPGALAVLGVAAE